MVRIKIEWSKSKLNGLRKKLNVYVLKINFSIKKLKLKTFSIFYLKMEIIFKSYDVTLIGIINFSLLEDF
jgi:hypothetical protein